MRDEFVSYSFLAVTILGMCCFVRACSQQCSLRRNSDSYPRMPRAGAACGVVVHHWKERGRELPIREASAFPREAGQ